MKPVAGKVGTALQAGSHPQLFHTWAEQMLSDAVVSEWLPASAYHIVRLPLPPPCWQR